MAIHPNLFGCPSGCVRVLGPPYCAMGGANSTQNIPCRPPVQHRKEDCFEHCKSEFGGKNLASCPSFCGFGGACCRHQSPNNDSGACAIGLSPSAFGGSGVYTSQIGCEGVHCCVTRGPWCINGIVSDPMDDNWYQKRDMRKGCCNKTCGVCMGRGCSDRAPGCCHKDMLERVCVGPEDVACVIPAEGGIYSKLPFFPVTSFLTVD